MEDKEVQEARFHGLMVKDNLMVMYYHSVNK